MSSTSSSSSSYLDRPEFFGQRVVTHVKAGFLFPLREGFRETTGAGDAPSVPYLLEPGLQQRYQARRSPYVLVGKTAESRQREVDQAERSSNAARQSKYTTVVRHSSHRFYGESNDTSATLLWSCCRSTSGRSAWSRCY